MGKIVPITNGNQASNSIMESVLDFLFNLQYDPWFRSAFYEDDIKTIAYSKVAAEDIWKRLKDSNKAPLMILEEYRELMDGYSLKNHGGVEIFRIGGDVAQYFIDLMS